jgi:hypothetical protein
MSDDLRELGLVPVPVTLLLGYQQVTRTFVVSPDPADPHRPDVAELERRVEEWKREQKR